MNVSEFIAKWEKAELTERASAQEHFLDLCDLLGHPKPAQADPSGESFTFERGAEKNTGGDGFADVWKKGFFGWEYKRKHRDLGAAYQQLLHYAQDLENPPLMVVCDMDRIRVHTNFTNRPVEVHEIPLSELGEPRNLEILRAVFYDPDKLKPGATSAAITAHAAERLGEIAQSMRGRGLDPHQVARFLDRIVFCLFAEDVELLPKDLFGQLVRKSKEDPERFGIFLRQLFDVMATGGYFGVETIKHFNGDLFTECHVPEVTEEEIEAIHGVAGLDWAAIDPSIFGTLFERGMDPSKRAQIGAHFTGGADIEVLVEAVVMQPLRREWADAREVAENLLATGSKRPSGGPARPLSPAAEQKARREAEAIIRRFLIRLQNIKVLDPACGSANFLYVTLQKLMDLEKEVWLFAARNGFHGFHGIHGFQASVGPWQLYGIEINPYAHELAQMTVWIGYLQWIRANGYGVPEKPVLRKMDNFKCMDAIIDLSDPANPKEPEWPRVDFIVGNPPFLGNKLMREQLGDDYVKKLRALYAGRLPNGIDLCCYWFERARKEIEKGTCVRAGLLATQGIRGGANRAVLVRIKEAGDIFFAESDRPWVLNGANVHVSMIGFSAAPAHEKVLDGRLVSHINANLTSSADMTKAAKLECNLRCSFQGPVKVGDFDIQDESALNMLGQPNPNGRPNSDVVTPWMNGISITGREPNMWIIDFRELPIEEASRFQIPFEHVQRFVKPARENIKRQRRATFWWHHGEVNNALRSSFAPLERYLATCQTAKHRFYVWLPSIVLPGRTVIVFARSDDYFFGVLHSRLHEVWARAQGTQLRERESGFRYTPTTCFETFPLPRPSPEQEKAIGEAAKELDTLRNNWLNPQEWTKEETLQFPGSANGPWARYVVGVAQPPSAGIDDSTQAGAPVPHLPQVPHRPEVGIVRYPRLVPKDAESATNLAKRTLTNLYNERPAWLAQAHKKLDAAVFSAYAWDPAMADEQILEKLLALNLERAAQDGRA